MSSRKRPRGREPKPEEASKEQAMGTEGAEIPVEPTTVEPVTEPEFDAESMPDAETVLRDMAAQVAAKEAEPAAASAVQLPIPPQVMPAIQAGIAQAAAAEEAEAQRLAAQGGEMRIYYAMRGGKACNLKIEVSHGEPPRHDAHGNVLRGTGTTSKMIEFGKGSNPPGTYRSADADEQALIEGSRQYGSTIRRADIQDLEEVGRLLAKLEAKGVALPPGVSASIKDRLAVATGKGHGPQIQHGARSTRVPSAGTGTSQGFVGLDGLASDPKAVAALAKGQ